MRKIICIFFMILVLTILPAGCSSANVSSQSSQTVTFSIRCDTAVANGMANEEKWEGIIPEDGCILPETEIRDARNALKRIETDENYVVDRIPVKSRKKKEDIVIRAKELWFRYEKNHQKY